MSSEGVRRRDFESSPEDERLSGPGRRYGIYELPLLPGLVVPEWLQSIDAPVPGGSPLRQVAASLDSLQALGFDILYVAGLFLRGKEKIKGTAGTMFCVADHTKIDPQWGSDEDFGALVAEAKRRGMPIGLDLVFNHAAHDSVLPEDFFIKGPDGRIQPGRCTDFSGDQESSVVFDDVLQLDLSNPQVREYCKGVVEYWVRRGVTFFRIDLAAQLTNQRFARRWQVNMPAREWLADIITAARDINPAVVFMAEAHGEATAEELYVIGFDIVTSKADEHHGLHKGYFDALVSGDPNRIDQALGSLWRMRYSKSTAGVAGPSNHDTPALQRLYGDRLPGALIFSIFLRPLLWVASTESGFDYEGDQYSLDPFERGKQLPQGANYPVNFFARPALLERVKSAFRAFKAIRDEFGEVPDWQPVPRSQINWCVGIELISRHKPDTRYVIILNSFSSSIPTTYGQIPAFGCLLVKIVGKKISQSTILTGP